MKTPVDVVAAVVRNHGKILLCSRTGANALSGYFEFPGGKVKDGETLADGLKREIREELASRVFVLDRIGENLVAVGKRSCHLYFLRAVFCPGAPEPCPQEGQVVRWVAVADLERWPLLPGDAPLARLLARTAKNHSSD